MLDKPLIPWLRVETEFANDQIEVTAGLEYGEFYRKKMQFVFSDPDHKYKVKSNFIDIIAMEMAKSSNVPAYICRKMVIEAIANPFKTLPYVIGPDEINEYYDGMPPEIFAQNDHEDINGELSHQASRLPGMSDPAPPCPQCGRELLYLSTTIIHMNDKCLLTREQIAHTLQEWHDQGLINIAFKIGEPNAKH